MDDFSLDGFLASQNGIVLQKPVSLASAVPIYNEAQIAGRSGTLVSFTGAYKNRKAEASCYSLSSTLMNDVSSVSNFLFSTVGYRRLQMSYDSAHFLKARIINGAEIQQRLEKLNPFKIVWDCMPQRFLTSGENNTLIYTSGDTITNPTSFSTKPLLRINGTTGTAGTITINDVTITLLNIVDWMYIDCETENAYGAVNNYNSNISATVFPELKSGANAIYFTGEIDHITIVPRWWEL